MVRVDFHYYTVDKALAHVEHLISQARMNEPFNVRFITGQGVIKKQLVKLLKLYSIEGKEELGNPGVITAYLE